MARGWERALLAAWIFALVVRGVGVAILTIGLGIVGLAGSLVALGWIPLLTFLAWRRVRARRLGHESLPPHRPMPQPVTTPDEDAAFVRDLQDASRTNAT